MQKEKKTKNKNDSHLKNMRHSELILARLQLAPVNSANPLNSTISSGHSMDCLNSTPHQIRRKICRYLSVKLSGADCVPLAYMF